MLLVYCLHGDEIVSEQIAKKMNGELGIEIYLGNPTARQKRVRFIESDLNRSFGKTGTLEAERTIEIRRDLSQKSEDLVIDLHTTKSKMLPVAIITNLEQLQFVAKTGLRKVIYMSKEFSTGGSLIENVPNSFSIEIYPDDESIQMIENAIRHAHSSGEETEEFEVYKVVEIVKGEKDPLVKNLEQLDDGSYPIFAGETSYKGVNFLRTEKKFVKLKKR